MKDFARQLTQKCVSMGLLDESYSEWFAYSIEKRVTTLLTWLVQCLIGGFFFGWTLTISFSVFFLLIRKYTNGYHAATYSKCLFHSILLEVVLLASISYVFRTGLALFFLTIVSDVTIWCIAPVNNKDICSLVIIASKYFRNSVGESSNRTLHTTRVGRSIDC